MGRQIETGPSQNETHVFVGTSTGEVVAVEKASATKTWTTVLGWNGLSSPPTLCGPVVVFASNMGNIYGLDANTGDVNWCFSTEHDQDVILGSQPLWADPTNLSAYICQRRLPISSLRVSDSRKRPSASTWFPRAR